MKGIPAGLDETTWISRVDALVRAASGNELETTHRKAL
jgi:hypothetical protein